MYMAMLDHIPRGYRVSAGVRGFLVELAQGNRRTHYFIVTAAAAHQVDTPHNVSPPIPMGDALAHQIGNVEVEMGPPGISPWSAFPETAILTRRSFHYI